jgi:hypothetical protein
VLHAVRRRRRLLIRVALVAAPVISVTWCTVRENRLEASFHDVSRGMTPTQVTKIIGTPSWEGVCGAKMPTGLPTSCTREFG